MRVRATQRGYYGHKRRSIGEEFHLVPQKRKDGSFIPVDQMFSHRWMEKVDVVSSKSKRAKKEPDPEEEDAEEEGSAPTGDKEVI